MKVQWRRRQQRQWHPICFCDSVGFHETPHVISSIGIVGRRHQQFGVPRPFVLWFRPNSGIGSSFSTTRQNSGILLLLLLVLRLLCSSFLLFPIRIHINSIIIVVCVDSEPRETRFAPRRGSGSFHFQGDRRGRRNRVSGTVSLWRSGRGGLRPDTIRRSGGTLRLRPCTITAASHSGRNIHHHHAILRQSSLGAMHILGGG